MRTKTQKWIFIGVIISLIVGTVGYSFLRNPLSREDGMEEGVMAPTLDLTSAQGERLDSEEFKEKAYLLTFFSSWCFSCRMEHKVLGTLAQKLNIPLVGVAFQDTPDAIFNWLARYGNPFARISFDKLGEMGKKWGITGVPETFLIDKNGTIRAHVRGALFSDGDIDYLENAIKNL